MAEAESNHSLSLNLVNTRTSITYYVQLRFSTSSPWNISHLIKAEENWGKDIVYRIYIMGGFCPGGFCPRGILSRGILSGGFCLGGLVRGILS